MQANNRKQTKRTGFTLVELVVVILILGILAAIASPKMFDTAGDARTNATKTSLAVIRDSIELYKAQNSSYPAAPLATTLKPFIRGPFPKSDIGNKNANVATSTADPVVVVGATDGWAYNATTGEFVVNHADGIAW